MAPPRPTFFLIPGWKDEDFSDDIILGNIISDVKAPEKSIYSPNKSVPVLTLAKPSKQQIITDFQKGIEDEKKITIGLFAKILEILGVGLDLSRSKEGLDTDKYAVDKMTLKTFRPTPEFLDAVIKPQNVQDQLTEGATKRVFLVTGTITAEGIKYTSKVSREKEIKGSFGINANGFNAGPSASNLKKAMEDIEFKVSGPTLLAFRVQKIQLGADQKPEASPEDGDFFDGDGEEDESESKPEEWNFNAVLDARDKAGMEVIEIKLDIVEDHGDDDSSEEDKETDYLLVVPKRMFKAP